MISDVDIEPLVLSKHRIRLQNTDNRNQLRNADEWQFDEPPVDVDLFLQRRPKNIFYLVGLGDKMSDLMVAHATITSFPSMIATTPAMLTPGYSSAAMFSASCGVSAS